ncbi:hypothetical protein Taro_034329 [Colocasia esculenta]|uniref:Uncharacterized protein n=1 Tax=Colocasia esculenta TaxID=4460 RepID=A0A843VXI5_COLES|nr:hypothetical protein [Colocasia esculenta]
MTSTEHSSTTPPEKVVYQPQTTTHTGYRYLLSRGTTMETTTSHTHTSHNQWQSTSRKARRHHTGIDYWFMTPVSNSDNTTQELPLSLAATNVRSNCSSTTTSKAKELWRPTKPPQPIGHTPCRPMPGTFRDSGLSPLK